MIIIYTEVPLKNHGSFSKKLAVAALLFCNYHWRKNFTPILTKKEDLKKNQKIKVKINLSQKWVKPANFQIEWTYTIKKWITEFLRGSGTGVMSLLSIDNPSNPQRDGVFKSINLKKVMEFPSNMRGNKALKLLQNVLSVNKLTHKSMSSLIYYIDLIYELNI